MVNNDDFSNRLEKILDTYGLNASTLADEIEINRSTVSHLLSGRNKPSLDLIMKLHARFPEVALEWWIYGEGESQVVPKTSDLVNPQKLSEVKLPQDKEVAPPPSSSSEKSIERILVCYTDGTFREYKSL